MLVNHLELDLFYCINTKVFDKSKALSLHILVTTNVFDGRMVDAIQCITDNK